MPLTPGAGAATIAHNIAEMRRAGRPEAQAAAAAERNADKFRHDVAFLLDNCVALEQRLAARHDREFSESDHPREEDGKFTEGAGSAGGARGALKETRIENGKRVTASGAALPEHVQKLKLPPAWTDVRYSEDPDAPLQAVGKDSKGRVQAVYSAAFTATQAAAKFARINDLMEKFPEIRSQNDSAMHSENPRARDTADCLDLIMKMGVRPGSDTDTKAKVKAYGATTLEGKHVVKDGDDVYLRFTGKKGVALNLRVDDPALAKMLTKRADEAGADGRLFGSTSDKSLLDHVHSLDGGGFKTKDFRTHVGTATALRLVSDMPKPENERAYKRQVMEVAKKVAAKLGNTPAIALQSYINPAVFAEWRMAA